MNDPWQTAMLVAKSGPHQLWIAVAVTLAFTVLARYARGVSRSGSVAGAVICFVLYASSGVGAFLALVAVFGLTWVTTRLGLARKRKLGTAEDQEGRSASQVLANLAVAAACAAFSAITGNSLFLLAAAAALSEAAADTVSSELGQVRNETARLITTWNEVPAGTDGGVSAAGTAGGVAAATLVSCVCLGGGLLPLRWLAVSIVAAVIGMLADSVLGAVLERRRLLNNDWVNFLGTLVAAGVAVLLA